MVFYISGHGFGHASRQVELINALRRLDPSVDVVVRTSAPRWLFDLTLSAPVTFEAGACDTGVVQIDSLTLDAERTIREASDFHRTLPDRVHQEAARIRPCGPALVVGDIPPLAFPVAQALGVPGIGIANFTWDWIYDGYDLTQAPDLVPAIQDAYALADAAWRLPMCGGFSAFRQVDDLPFIARRSDRYSKKLAAF